MQPARTLETTRRSQDSHAPTAAVPPIARALAGAWTGCLSDATSSLGVLFSVAPMLDDSGAPAGGFSARIGTGAAAAPFRLLEASADGFVATLGPYDDAATGSPAVTVLEGRVRADRITGTFLTRTLDDGRTIEGRLTAVRQR